ncbi:MAG: orotate phosphoribosyltransferase [Bacteroidota bacterium]|nr:orotate phosphoribosyltransferase [Bacteroidota bacterium]
MNNSDNILEIFEQTGAMLKGHFLLTSGRHSNVYFQCAKVLQFPKFTELLCTKIVEYFKDTEIDVVIAPAIGGIVVAQEIGRLLGKKTIFAERENGSLTLRRGFSLNEGDRVLVCEDVVTTGGSVFEVIDIVKKANAIVAGVGYIVDRSSGKVNFGFPQFSTVNVDVISYAPDACPLCKDGKLPAIKPGSRKI